MIALLNLVLCAIGVYYVVSLAALGSRLASVSKPAPHSAEYLEMLQGIRRETAPVVDASIRKRAFLIIGGTGFTGTVIADDLMARGAKHVRVMSRVWKVEVL